MPRWTPKEGPELDIRDMTADHLENARRAVADGRVNPYKDYPETTGYVRWRDTWVQHFDLEIRRRGLPDETVA